MPFDRRGESMSADSFLRGHGRNFPQQDVVIVHAPGTLDEKRTSSRVQPQADAGFFDIDTPIYDGDIVEMDDPRGGTRRLYVTKVDLNDTRGGSAFRGISHIKAHWTEGAPRPLAGTTTTTYNAPVVHVHGDHAQLAWDSRSVTQSSGDGATISAGYQGLAKAVTDALDLLTAADDVDAEDVTIAREGAETVLAQVTSARPDTSVIRKGLAALRGVLSTAANAAATEGGRNLIAALALPSGT